MSDDITVRDFVAGIITAAAPDTWLIVPTVDLPATLTKPTVTITHNKITPHQSINGAPTLSNRVVVRIASPSTFFEAAETQLDDQVLLLCHTLTKVQRITFVDADKLKVPDTAYLSWELIIDVLSSDPITD